MKRDVQLHAYMMCADRLKEALDGMKCWRIHGILILTLFSVTEQGWSPKLQSLLVRAHSKYAFCVSVQFHLHQACVHECPYPQLNLQHHCSRKEVAWAVATVMKAIHSFHQSPNGLGGARISDCAMTPPPCTKCLQFCSRKYYSVHLQ